MRFWSAAASFRSANGNRGKGRGTYMRQDYYELFLAWDKYRLAGCDKYREWYDNLSVEEMQLIPLVQYAWECGNNVGRKLKG